jgi:Integrase core domain
MGIRDRPAAPRSPWQNAYAERLIGSIRREVLDHGIVFGEHHLRQVLSSHLTYHNEASTHLSLNKDAPVPRSSRRRTDIRKISSRRMASPTRSDLIYGKDRREIHVTSVEFVRVSFGA